VSRQLIDPPLDASAYPYAHAVRVRFAETDAMGVVHHAAYLPWLEEARVALLAHGGHDYAEIHANGIDLAVVEVAIRYRRAIRFGDHTTVHVAMAAATRSVIQLAYLLEVDGAIAASAVTSHACVNPEGRPLRVPDWLGELASGDTALR